MMRFPPWGQCTGLLRDTLRKGQRPMPSAFMLTTLISSNPTQTIVYCFRFSLTSALVVGGILALLTLFKFPYSVQLNLAWLGTAWYDPWIAIFLVGAPIMLAFVV